jgi:membrane complex biogenesis BtpA family protein
MTHTLGPFGVAKPLIGVVHLDPLPGSPRYGGSMRDILARAAADALALAGGGMDGLLVENFGDAPFFADMVPAETIAAMTRLCSAVIEAVSIPVGVNVLRNDARAALAIAAASGATFIRVNVHTGAAWTDQGLITGRAAETLRLRRSLGAEVAIFADIGVKHAAPTAERPLALVAEETATRGGADALIVTGERTGGEVRRDDLEALRSLPVPVLVGSGLHTGNVLELLERSDGAIVGTSLKRDGRVSAPVDPIRVRALVERAREARDARS